MAAPGAGALCAPGSAEPDPHSYFNTPKFEILYNTLKYIPISDVIDNTIVHFNYTKHPSINFCYGKLASDGAHLLHKPQPKFTICDKGCVAEKHEVFCKSYLPLWLEEMFEAYAKYLLFKFVLIWTDVHHYQQVQATLIILLKFIARDDYFVR
jgi:hypothetical protein